eukprot:1012586-Rhodomonas_salina.2
MLSLLAYCSTTRQNRTSVPMRGPYTTALPDIAYHTLWQYRTRKVRDWRAPQLLCSSLVAA